MKAIMSSENLNRLIDATKGFCAVCDAKPIHQWIRVEFGNDVATAIALDGYKMSIERANCAELDESFIAYIKPGIKKFPKGQEVEIQSVGDKLYLTCGENIIGFKQPEDDSGFLDWRKTYADMTTQDPKYKIAFNANYIFQAIQSIKASTPNYLKKPVVVEFRSPLAPVILRAGDTGERIVLPVRMGHE